MFWLLPDARDWLPALVERAGSEPGFLDHHLNGCCRRVRVGKFLIPQFKMSSGFEASSATKKLGLGCDLMAIVHEAVIEVDENGTKAAAATCARSYFGDGEVSKPDEEEDFVADHTFMFLIREDLTGTVMFMGQVLNPLAG
ncbi:putative Serpin family protein [Rosa chinensis]|uniref:Putative Serpin family protein n=1 Tax=Rosa chinensis TaxID=74649 RepID=A0A2P6R706_ROSCH|nr:serpin-ZXA [Rosa chinensis]PRQ42215.1 putative Serpin family protein [Rosa chinensis]